MTQFRPLAMIPDKRDAMSKTRAEILAVYPEEDELRFFEKMPPLGMLWVCGRLRQAGFGIDFIDQQVDGRAPAAIAARKKPLLALVGGTSHSRFESFSLARDLKRASPETIVVYGGPHATFTGADTLSHVPSIDIVVHGEGEETASEIAEWAMAGARADARERIRGISYRENGHVLRTAPRPLIEDIDSLGPPPRDLVPLIRYRTTLEYLGLPATSVITGRGCPIGCTFCSASAMFGPTYRKRSAALVVDEIEKLHVDHGILGFKIFDSTFTLSRSHVLEFCEEIRRRGLIIPWECEVRVGSVDPPLLEKMRRAGCYYIDIGIEAGTQRVLDQCIRKRILLSDAEQLLKWSQEAGLLTKVFFTLGHPGEKYEEAKETNRFIWRNRRRIRLAGYQAVRIYPGTSVEEFAQRERLLPADFDWSTPYVNEANRQLLRPVDNIPILLQSGLGIRELRRLRMDFVASRILSPRYLREKIIRIRRSGALRRYSRILVEAFR
jgi:anaerobic magnesium-protoporphyrin IX monomethyl ester cyclase